MTIAAAPFGERPFGWLPALAPVVAPMGVHEAVYRELVTATEAARAAWVGPPTPLVVTYENRTLVDLAAQVDSYLCADVHFLDGEQDSLGGSVVDVIEYGQLHLVAHTRRDAGTLKGRQILDHFRPFVELKSFTVCRTMAARGHATYDRPGWHCIPLVVPFRFHRLAT